VVVFFAFGDDDIFSLAAAASAAAEGGWGGGVFSFAFFVAAVSTAFVELFLSGVCERLGFLFFSSLPSSISLGVGSSLFPLFFFFVVVFFTVGDGDGLFPFPLRVESEGGGVFSLVLAAASLVVDRFFAAE
jgi:hypothetical protein